MGFNEFIFFSGFIIFILGMLALDLGVFSSENKEVTFREAGIWSTIWVMLAAVFYVILDTHGDLIHGINSFERLHELIGKYADHIKVIDGDLELSIQYYRDNMSLEFITGYLIEYALSVDNIFVIILIFSSFGVSEKYYKKVLFWGILGAVVMRFIFIFAGAALLQKFGWIMYIFGGFLVFTGIRMFFDRGDENIDTANHPVVKIASKYFKVFPKYVGDKFFVRKNGALMITPLFVVLLIIEFTDLIFAVDSVPAVFSVTKDPYIVFFSNIFAILGLRSMFFFLARVMHLFHFLKYGLAVLLTFIGTKMLAHTWLKEIGFTNAYSLYVIISILTVSIVASLLFPKKRAELV